MSLVDLVAGSVVRVGSGNKAAVLAIQTALGITADGDFGDGTEAAVDAGRRMALPALARLFVISVLPSMLWVALRLR
jgi:hypothetical protein